MARLNVVVCITGDRRDYRLRAIFSACLIGVLLTNAAFIVVRHDNDGLLIAIMLPHRLGDGNHIRRAIGHNARPICLLMDCRSGGEALGDIKRSRFIKSANLPERTPRLTTTVIFLAAFCIDILQRRNIAIDTAKGHDQAAITGDARAMWFDAFLCQIGMRFLRSRATAPYLASRVSGDLLVPFALFIAHFRRFLKALRVLHFLYGRKLSPYALAKRTFDIRTKTPYTSGPWFIWKDDIPAWF